jgi:hypothetical protein
LVEAYKSIYDDQAHLPYEQLLGLARDEQKRVRRQLVPMSV